MSCILILIKGSGSFEARDLQTLRLPQAIFPDHSCLRTEAASIGSKKPPSTLGPDCSLVWEASVEVVSRNGLRIASPFLEHGTGDLELLLLRYRFRGGRGK